MLFGLWGAARSQRHDSYSAAWLYHGLGPEEEFPCPSRLTSQVPVVPELEQRSADCRFWGAQAVFLLPVNYPKISMATFTNPAVGEGGSY